MICDTKLLPKTHFFAKKVSFPYQITVSRVTIILVAKKLTIIFLVWFAIGVIAEIVLGQIYPQRQGSSASFLDYLALPIPFLLLLFSIMHTSFSKIRKKLKD